MFSKEYNMLPAITMNNEKLDRLQVAMVHYLPTLATFKAALRWK